MRRGNKETVNLSLDPPVLARIDKERDITPRSTWINEFLKVFFSDDHPTAIKLRRYVALNPGANLREMVRSLLDHALDDELAHRGLKRGPQR
jgi:hypothetical protein